MSSKHKHVCILTLLLAVPLLGVGIPAAPYQGGGHGGGQGGGAAAGRCLPMTS